MKKTTVLMILDGFGITDKAEGNAIKAANTPNIDGLMTKYPYKIGYASGLDVGLPAGQMGNSEVGHLNIGAGRIIYQDYTRISKDIEDGGFFKNEALLAAVKNAKDNNTAVHIYGLLSDGGVHSDIAHLFALLKMMKQNDVKDVYVHAFMDGRDTAPTSGIGFIESLEENMRSIGIGKIASVMGRYYAMDRDNRFERTKLAYDALVSGSPITAKTAAEIMHKSYDEGVTDEFIKPAAVVDEEGKPVGLIKSGDSIIFFDFRPDRARQLTRAFCDPEFDGFEKTKNISNITYVCFTDYDHTIPNKLVAYGKLSFKNTLGEYAASLGLKQLRLAETEKYAHVTFFFNGGIEEPNKNEDRILVPSPKVATYDLKPEMSALEVTDELIKAIKGHEYDLIIINYANTDMVGHTGIFDAAVKAVECIDKCVDNVVKCVIDENAQMFICADHGNIEKMVDYETGEPFTAHTTNPVPFILVNYTDGIGLRDGGKLADIAPTLLAMMGIKKPEEMTGESLLV